MIPCPSSIPDSKFMLEVAWVKVMIGQNQELRFERSKDQKVFTDGTKVLILKQSQAFQAETKTVLNFVENIIFDLTKTFGWSYVEYAKPADGLPGQDLQSVLEAPANIEGNGN